MHKTRVAPLKNLLMILVYVKVSEPWGGIVQLNRDGIAEIPGRLDPTVAEFRLEGCPFPGQVGQDHPEVARPGPLWARAR